MRLKDIATVRTGLVTARKKADAFDLETFSYRLVTLKSFSPKGTLNIDFLDDFVSNEKIKKVYLTQDSDILVRLREPNIAIYVDEANIGLVIPSFVASIRVDKTKVDVKFLTYYLNSTVAKKLLKSSLSGTSINMIKTKELEELKVQFPPLDKQKQIAKFLDIGNKEISLLEELKQQKTKYYNQLFINILKKEDIK